MKGALAYEWVRVRTVRSTWILSAAALLVTVLAAVAFALNPTSGSGGGSPDGPPPDGAADRIVGDQAAYAMILTATAQLTPLLMGLLGAFAFGHEYRYGTIRPALAALPRRGDLAAAKVLVVALWAAVVGVLGVALSAVVAVLLRGSRYAPDVSLSGGATPRVALGVVPYIVLSALVGLAFAWLFRNLPAAVTLLLVLPLIVEPLLRAVLSIGALDAIAGIGRYLPFGAGGQLFAYSTAVNPDIPAAFRNDLSPLAGGLTFALVTAALLAVAYLLFRRRDA